MKPIPETIKKPLRGALAIGTPVEFGLGQKGTVRALFLTATTLSYSVRYVDYQGVTRDDYFNVDELKDLSPAPVAPDTAPAA